VLEAWATEWAKEGKKEVDWRKLLPLSGFLVLPRRWVVERTFSWIDHNRRMSKDYENPQYSLAGASPQAREDRA
jgi:transposase